MSRRIGDNESAPRCGEVAVGYIDRDALLPFRAQSVGYERQVEVLFAPLLCDTLNLA